MGKVIGRVASGYDHDNHAFLAPGSTADKDPSSFVRAGEFVIRAAMSWPSARISDSACLVCAAKQSSPVGERMVRAQ